MKPGGLESINVQLARKCLMLISDIAQRGASSWNPECVGYALEELSQVMVERTGDLERWFEPIPAGEILDVNRLAANLDWVNTFSEDMTFRTFH